MEIANIGGVSLTLVHRKLAQGKSAREIIAEAVAHEQQAAAKHPNVAVTGLINGHAGNGALSFATAQAAKETALAELRQLELMERRQELIPLVYVRTWASRFLVEGRDVLLNGPGELADRLAVENDPLRVREILQGWVDHIMTRFFELETLWGGGEPLDQGVLRERFEAARLATMKPRR
jgi:hypothetical protein